MPETWSNLEAHVRTLAALIYDREAGPDHIGGVDIDCVVKLSNDNYILIEITEERSLNKVRSDIIKLNTARNALFNQSNIYARCICVIDADSVTQAMRDAGKPTNISVITTSRFAKSFFDFPSYNTARQRYQFGSAVNPVTGAIDESKYVPVSYIRSGKELSISNIADLLLEDKKIIMTGEYGSGKSRCVREIFFELSQRSEETNIYPIAIDLKENWGLKRAQEIIRRHFDDLGLPNLANSILKTINNNYFIFILDGFDELGFQSWSDDHEKLKNMRSLALEGVRDLIARTNGGVFICGREHYFNNNDEMFQSLGIDGRNSVTISSKEEFSEQEMADYMSDISEDYQIPSWVPRRPLICQTIISLPEDDLDRMLGQLGGDLEFWHRFMELLCKRDTRISTSLDADTIYNVLLNLARVTRTKAANVGAISLGEIQKAFEAVVGQLPDEQASVMLQRLPGLGRVKSESNDRQFIDTFILDGLRAVDVDHMATKGEKNIESLTWRNPLEQLGQRILANLIGKNKTQKVLFQLANKCTSSRNIILGCDIISALVRLDTPNYDFNGLIIDEGHFIEFDMTAATPINLQLTNSTFGKLIICGSVPRGTSLKACVASNVYGVTSAKGLPSWADVIADHFETTDNTSRIRRLGLQPNQEILVTIIRKTFFQKGTGRKEEALLRGLGRIGSNRTSNRVLNILVNQDILTKFKGDEGIVYAPVRSNADRMQKMLAELNTSQDIIWKEISEL